jgi:hypothetical protein
VPCDRREQQLANLVALAHKEYGNPHERAKKIIACG